MTMTHNIASARAAAHALDLDRLRADLKGQVIAPGDAGYDAARTTFYGGIDRRPAVILRPVDVREVSYIVTLARQTGLPLAVPSGGLSPAGHSVVDGAHHGERGRALHRPGRGGDARGLGRRLRAGVGRDDPTNLFRLNQNIAPAAL